MPLSDQEKAQIKYHLGYAGTETGTVMMLGFPRNNQFLYLIDTALTKIREENLARVRQLVCTLNSIEAKMEQAACMLAVESIGDIKMRGSGCDSYPEMLEREYIRWSYRLADLIGAPPFPYAARFMAHPPSSFECGPKQVRNVRMRR